MADEVTLDTIAANQELMLTALGTLATKLDTVASKLDTLTTAVGTVNTSTGSVKDAILHRHW